MIKNLSCESEDGFLLFIASAVALELSSQNQNKEQTEDVRIEEPAVFV